MKQLLFVLLAALSVGACASDTLPRRSPALVGLEEPLEWMEEPDDEAQRRALAPGAFTGVVVGDARASLDQMLDAPQGLAVIGVVENSPAASAGLVVGDLLLEARSKGETVALAWPADWRRMELECEPGASIFVLVDRAGAEREFELKTVARVAPAARRASARFTEDQRVGLVVRTATEVEARAAALGPGGGAVVVGLTRESPWRAVGIGYGDLIRAVDGVELAHPQVLLDRVRAAPAGASVTLEIVRAGRVVSVDAPLSRRESQMDHVRIPLLYSFSRERDQREHSLLLGAIRWRSTPAAWDLRLLWLFSFGGGDSTRLERVQ